MAKLIIGFKIGNKILKTFINFCFKMKIYTLCVGTTYVSNIELQLFPQMRSPKVNLKPTIKYKRNYKISSIKIVTNDIKLGKE